MRGKGFLLIIFTVSLLFTIAIYMLAHRPRPNSGRTGPGQSIPSLRGAKKTVLVFFIDPRQGSLVGEEREITLDSATDTVLIRNCLRQLLIGPYGEGMDPVVPPQTELSEVFIDHDHRIVYLDFNSHLTRDYPGGAETELLTVYALVNTVCYNFPEIQKVQILVEGKEIESLAGHVYMGGPLTPQWRLNATKTAVDYQDRGTGRQLITPAPHPGDSSEIP